MKKRVKKKQLKDDDQIISENNQLSIDGIMDSDIPEEVIGAKMQSGKIMVTVRWKERIDGIRPKDTVILNEIVKERWPRILVDFYESRIKTKSKD